MTFSKIFTVAAISVLLFSCSENNPNKLSKIEATIKGRAEFELERLQDPVTGKIPDNIRLKELAFASSLPKTLTKTARASTQIFEPIGPRNVGGRTRAISFDIDMPNVVLAGGVSGGMWRSIDLGQSWNRVTNFEDQSAVSCIIQDQRPGKSNIFYYGSGESDGNSASKSFSAYYYGSGMYKSVDHGATWTHVASTTSPVQKRDDWSYIYNIALDNSRTDKDIVYAATSKGIRRSENGGTTWTLVLGGNGNADYTNVVTTSTGVCYAHISSNGNPSGFWRSTDGITWVSISPTDLPGNHGRTLMAIAPSNENTVYFYSVTDGSGLSDVSFWKYQYLNGDGAGNGGSWINRSSTLPPAKGYSLNTFDGYCMSLAVKPDNENIVFLGGTNLFNSVDGFNTRNATSQIGGYDADGYSNFDMYRDNQHPDQQSLAFKPNEPNKMLAGTDGGLHYTIDPIASKVIWQSFNNGYQTTQFYGIGIDHLEETEIVVSGYQDNGSWWTDGADTNTDWIFTMGGDGAYCAKENATNNYYFSSQEGYIRRVKVNATGTAYSNRSATPPNLAASGYLFVHPFTLDPTDNNKMYLPHASDLWRNSNLAGIDNGQNNWTKIGSVSGNDITTVEASISAPGTVFVGTRSRAIYKIEDDGSATATVTNISSGISSGTYTSNIAVSPDDVDKVIAIYSNYNVISIWYTEDGGANWSDIEGNLKGDSDPGVPPNLSYIGNGPSFRWAKFIKTDNGTSLLVGTSIGLFATNNIDGENTVWIQQASDVIGNTVIEQIDYRQSDGFCVIGTHGMGAFKTYFENNWDITSVENAQTNSLQLNWYPNPVINELNVSFVLTQEEQVQIDILNVNGQIIQTQYVNATTGNNVHSLNASGMASGTYFATIRTKSGNFTKAIIKE
jgi:hypothetical protein